MIKFITHEIKNKILIINDCIIVMAQEYQLNRKKIIENMHFGTCGNGLVFSLY